MINGLLQMLEVLGIFKRAFEFIFVINLHLEGVIEILYISLKLDVIFSQSGELNVLL